MQFRKAADADIDAIAALYDRIHDEEAAGRCTTGWLRGVYPVRAVAEESVALGDMFVAEAEDGRLLAAARLNREQVDGAYELVDWQYQAPPAQVMVLHTLVVEPSAMGQGVGAAFVGFYESYARAQGCRCLRLDTNARNLRARALYRRLGYREAAVVPCVFNSIPSVSLVCLEKQLS